MRTRYGLALLLLLALAVVTAACAQTATPTQTAPGAPTTAPAAQAGQAQPAPAGKAAAPVKGGTLTIALDSEPPTMDPHASPSAVTFYVLSSTCESLVYLDENRQLKPWLAESWEVTDGGKTFTFKLRKDVKFQDGAPFNAAAVKWNFDRIVDPSYKAGSALTSLFGYDKTEVVDESTVRVSFKNANAPFLTYAAGAPLAFVSPTGTPQQGDAVNKTPICTGPYKVEEYVAKDHVTISRWDGYGRSAPWSDSNGTGFVDKVVWKFVAESATRMATVESGESQVAAAVPAQDLPRLEGSKEMQVIKKPWVGTPRFWALNVTKPPTDDLKVRQAIQHAINKEAIVNTIYKGIGTVGFAPMAAVMMDDPALRAFYPYDLNKAKALLDEAGWKAGADGVRAKNGQRLEILLNDIDQGSGPQQVDVLIQGQLRELGMDVKLKTQARAPWYEDNYRCTTNGPVLFLRSGDMDGLTALFSSANVGSNFNFACIKDAEIDKMLDAGRSESDPAKRKQIYLDLQKKLMEMALHVPLADELSVWAARANVNGIKFNGYTYPIVTDAWIAK